MQMDIQKKIVRGKEFVERKNMQEECERLLKQNSTKITYMGELYRMKTDASKWNTR